jgi:signal transduction histidine kinase
MPGENGDIVITIILGTFLVLFFVLTIVFLISIFNKKNQLHQKEKEIIKANFEQTILQAQLEIQEQTFNTISQEIHDNVGQILSLAKVQLNIIEESENVDKGLLTDAQENISKAMTDLRDIAKGLNSERIRLAGLPATVEQEIQRINRVGIVHINLRISGNEQKTHAQKQLILFRIIQECLQNIIKHASASVVTILFIYQPESLSITITDNGKGFNFQQEKLAHHGLGLQNIFKRIELIGGKAEINSILQKGTTVNISIPYE